MKNNDVNKYDRLLSLKIKSSNTYELTEKDFYPPKDTRLHHSGVEDIVDGDNFADYVKYFYDQYEKEIFDT